METTAKILALLAFRKLLTSSEVELMETSKGAA